MEPRPLPTPPPGADAATAWVATHLGHLVEGPVVASGRFRGGQQAAEAALGRFDVRRYAALRNEVAPRRRRAASALSPWIRHGILPLPRLWDHVADAQPRDRHRFRDELRWQEYARHLYARLGRGLAVPLRFAQPAPAPGTTLQRPWDRTMACMDVNLVELEADGWLVNQARLWLSSQWAVRAGAPWGEGEDLLYRQLVDGSRAANRAGWQWAAGTATGRPYAFSRWQVEHRAPGLCTTCARRRSCPVQDPPDPLPGERLRRPSPLLKADPDLAATTGPLDVERRAPPAEAVWLTAESLGDADPALAANPGLPAVFVFDEPLLRRLRLSGARLVFLAECLADLAGRRTVEAHLGRPVDVLSGRAVAATHAPVPGWRSRAAAIRPVEVHPWPWLHRPHAGPVGSFSAWVKPYR